VNQPVYRCRNIITLGAYKTKVLRSFIYFPRVKSRTTNPYRYWRGIKRLLNQISSSSSHVRMNIKRLFLRLQVKDFFPRCPDKICGNPPFSIRVLGRPFTVIYDTSVCWGVDDRSLIFVFFRKNNRSDRNELGNRQFIMRVTRHEWKNDNLFKNTIY
jgi:hypothetical protein